VGIVVDELAATQGTVLDIGCGNGKFLSRLHKDRPDLRVVCMDISEGILTDVGTVLVADAQTVPFAENEAEAVRCTCDPAPAVAHLASYEAWAEQCGVPFEETVARARELVVAAIVTEGSFRITCLGGILVCRP
jgi:SAM-dependent methyltransferase